MENMLTLLPLIKKFKGRFFYGPITQYSWQYFPVNPKEGDDVIYLPLKCHCELGYKCDKHPRPELTDEDLLNHFNDKAMSSGNMKRSCLAVRALQNNRFKWFVVDSDNKESTDVLNKKLIPKLIEYGIDYIYEVGSTFDKCHIWFLVDCCKDVLSDFTEQLFEEADILFNSRDRHLNLEVYPTNKADSLIRVPGGLHLRNNQINPILYNGTMSSEPTFILNVFNSIKQYSEEEIKSLIKVKKDHGPTPEFILSKIKYVDQNLEVNYEVPPALSKVVRNCQAINKLVGQVINDKELDKRGWNVHTLGLYLANVCAGIDKFRQDEERTVFNWFLDVLDVYRSRSSQSHKWVEGLKTKGTRTKIPFCKTWERDFNLCGGCSFKEMDKFYSPRQLYENTSVDSRPKKIANINLKTIEEIRDTTFTKIKERVYSYAVNGVEKDILLASSMGSGKSFLADEITADLVLKHNKNVLIAVPTAELALEHRKRLRYLGVNPFILMSHTNLFKKDDGKRRFNIDFDCPKQEEISHLLSLGVDSSFYKKQFCGSCKYKDACPYPGQYSKAAEDDHKVVIIQHAHFSCRETLFNLINKKQFDVLIIDEEFIDSLIKMYKVSDTELKILEKFSGEIEWIDRLLDWFLEGSKDHKAIPKTQNDLEKIKEAFSEQLLPWNLPEYILQYNYKNHYNPESGLCLFYPLPNIPIRLFTDATPPVSMLKIITNNFHIEIFGQDEVLNHLNLNSKNKIIQVLDNSSSKASLEAYNERKLYGLIDTIGVLMKNVYKGSQGLLITYSGKHADLVTRFFRKNYPEVLPYLTISHMAIGTNKYENYKVLFQMAGVHFNSKQLAFNVYKLKCVRNFWKRIKGEPQIQNPYPKEITESSSFAMESVPLRRIEVGHEGPGVYEYPYPEYKTWQPKDKYYQLFYKLSLAKRQQAMRLRFNDKKEKHAYLFDSAPRETLLVTDSILLSELIFNS